MLIIGTYYVNIFSVEPDNIDKARYIAYFAAIGAITSWPMRSFTTILSGLQRYDISASIQLVVSFVNAVVTFIILINGYNIKSL